ncbi:hypothetical protein PSV08DRAFT_228615 [Bipolaris maydis]|nr:hypothetical protein J3E73DRAFT_238958 [Bipolaris maydis]KAJ6267912.1 hypothetical protein PSV08DRAFT_228615 [Bipolaris maydis]KAJ6277157.1 hypothetical protein J3E71DRAFT_225785 [Bipolaris maydis]
MLIDSSLNSVSTVLANVYQSFYEAAVRCLEYARVLSRVRKMGSGLLVKTVKNIITLAYVMLQRRSRSCRSREAIIAQSVISRRQLQWLGCKAFQAAFQGKQTRHRALLGWLKDSLSAACISSEIERRMLEDVVAGR